MARLSISALLHGNEQNILAIETTSEQCSVALLQAESITQKSISGVGVHSANLLPFIDELLKETGLAPADLNSIVVSLGPGSFTGVRVGMAAAMGFAQGADVSVIGVSSLAAIATEYWLSHDVVPVCAIADARMSEVYVGAYQLENGVVRSVVEDKVISPDAFLLPNDQRWHAAGSGLSAYKDQLIENSKLTFEDYDMSTLPTATGLIIYALLDKTAPFESLSDIEPNYLRNNVAKKSTK